MGSRQRKSENLLFPLNTSLSSQFTALSFEIIKKYPMEKRWRAHRTKDLLSPPNFIHFG
jgi:hypothetical protein